MGAGNEMTVSLLLGDDHNRLDAIMDEVRGRLSAGDLAGAASRFGAFRSGLERHIVAEEDVLFPALDRATGGRAGGPISVMRHEHAEIRKRLAEIGSILDRTSSSVTDAASPIGELVALLGAHNGKEERILYPMTDDSVRSSGSLEELVTRVREGLVAAAS